ncbi:MAG: acyl-CoA dehydrogenase, partial [Pseudomonadota bacterium]
KLGIHASPTCVMAYGEGDGAKGWLIGEENKGLACMFTMMNSARLTVGVQAVAIAERAYQQALDYAKERRQGQAVGAAGPGPSAIIDHPDIRRTLTDMKAKIAAGRAICYATGVAADEAEFGPEDKRAQAKRREDILTPIAKAWSSDRAIEIAYSGILIHGGMGFIEETGAAQHLRDACIAPIYEGTNGIQAIDLAGRKLSMAGGAALTELVDDIRATADACSGESDARFADFSDRLNAGASAMVACAEGLRTRMSEAPAEGLAGATPFLKLCGDVVGGWLLIKGALYALGQEASNPTYYGAKIQLARYFSETVLTAAPALVQEVNVGAALSLGLSDDALTAA